MPALWVSIQKSRWGIRDKTSVSDNGTSMLHFPWGMVSVFLFNSAGQNCLKELVAAKLWAGNTLKLSECRERFWVAGPFVGSYFVIAPGKISISVLEFQCKIPRENWLESVRGLALNIFSTSGFTWQQFWLCWPGQVADPWKVLIQVSKLSKSHYFSTILMPTAAGEHLKAVHGQIREEGIYSYSPPAALLRGSVQDRPHVLVCGCERSTHPCISLQEKLPCFSSSSEHQPLSRAQGSLFICWVQHQSAKDLPKWDVVCVLNIPHHHGVQPEEHPSSVLGTLPVWRALCHPLGWITDPTHCWLCHGLCCWCCPLAPSRHWMAGTIRTKAEITVLTHQRSQGRLKTDSAC